MTQTLSNSPADHKVQYKGAEPHEAVMLREITGNGEKYVISLPDYETDYIQSSVHKTNQPYESEMLEAMALGLYKNDLVIDVGANIGNHTLYFAAGLKCKVHAFEPNKHLCEALAQSVAANNLEDSVELYQCGIGAMATTASFRETNTKNLGAQTLTLGGSGSSDIPVFRLDDFTFDAPVAAMKVDVEGMEVDVLIGAESLIQKDKPLLVIESSDKAGYEAFESFITRNGYVYCSSFNGTPTHFFIHQDKVANSPWLPLFFNGGKNFHQMRYFHRKLKKAVAVLRKLGVKGW